MKAVRGITLIELVVVIILIGILAMALSPIMVSSLRAYNNTQNNVVILDKLRYAIERLAREMREVTDNDPDVTTNFALNMSTIAPVFTRDYVSCVDANCSNTTTNTVTVSIDQSASAVTLAYSSPAIDSQVLTDQLKSLTFSYYDKDGVSTISPVNVRYVDISLALVDDNNNTYSQYTRVQLRSR